MWANESWCTCLIPKFSPSRAALPARRVWRPFWKEAEGLGRWVMKKTKNIPVLPSTTVNQFSPSLPTISWTRARRMSWTVGVVILILKKSSPLSLWCLLSGKKRWSGSRITSLFLKGQRDITFHPQTRMQLLVSSSLLFARQTWNGEISQVGLVNSVDKFNVFKIVLTCGHCKATRKSAEACIPNLERWI